MITSVSNLKGGVGKTSLATNIALELAFRGSDVLVVDGDERQNSAYNFFAKRADLTGSPDVVVAKLSGASVRHQVDRQASKYDHIVIDVGGNDTLALRASLTVADTVLIPCQPRAYDLWSVAEMPGLIAEAQLINPGMRAYAVLMRSDPNTTNKDAQKAREVIEELEGIEFLPTPIVNRVAWAHTAEIGRGVSEPKRCDTKARDELWALVHAIFHIDCYDVTPMSA